jgi:hypothetical protein
MKTLAVSTIVVGVFVAVGLFARSGRADEERRKPFKATLQTTTRLAPQTDGAAIRCAPAPALEVVGAGQATFLGAVFDEQSHCLGPAGQFFDGKFTLTDSSGRTIAGEYSGTLIPTFNSRFTAPPGGSWLVRGNVCISGGTRFRNIKNDCAAGRFGSAVGITNLDNGDATIFLDLSIAFDDD